MGERVKMPPWTYSSLTTFETCPKQYYHKYVAKDFRDSRNEHNIWGDRVHEAIENAIVHQKPMPTGMEQWGRLIDKVKALPGEKLIEEKMAVGWDFRAAPYNDCWTRGKADFLSVYGREAAALDFKTGKFKPSEQLTLYAAYTFAHYPQVEVVQTGFVWLKNERITREVVRREELPEIWRSFVERASRLEQAYAEDTWPERPSGLCNGWCPVTSCKYHKPKK